MSTLKENAIKQIPMNLLILSSLFLLNVLIRPSGGNTSFFVIVAIASSVIAIARLYFLEKKLTDFKNLNH